MNPYYRLCVMVIRVIASACLLFSVLDLLLYWVKSRQESTAMTIGHGLYLSIPLVAGLVLLVKSSAWARQLADYIDD